MLVLVTWLVLSKIHWEWNWRRRGINTPAYQCTSGLIYLKRFSQVCENLIWHIFIFFRSEKEANYDEIVETLNKKLSNSEEENQAKGQEAATELLRTVEIERDSLKNEFDQERVAYQKLLKAYNKLEAQYENSQDELNAIKNPHGSEMNFDRYVLFYYIF